jgi:hypothetical protein
MIVKLLLVAPSAILTVAGGVAAVSVSLIVAIAPPAGAGDDRVTVPVRDLHPATADLESVRSASSDGAGLVDTVSEFSWYCSLPSLSRPRDKTQRCPLSRPNQAVGR